MTLGGTYGSVCQYPYSSKNRDSLCSDTVRWFILPLTILYGFSPAYKLHMHKHIYTYIQGKYDAEDFFHHKISQWTRTGKFSTNKATNKKVFSVKNIFITKAHLDHTRTFHPVQCTVKMKHRTSWINIITSNLSNRSLIFWIDRFIFQDIFLQHISGSKKL